MYALFPSYFPKILVLIWPRNVAFTPDAYFPNVLHDLCFRDTCLPHWRSQVHETWYSLWYVDHDFGLLLIPTHPPPFPLFLPWGIIHSPSPT